MKEETKKQRWIEKQQNEALKIHHKNIERIDKLENKIEHNLYLIYLLHISWNKLDLEQDSDEYGYGMDLLKEKSKKLALDIGLYQKDIDSNTKDDSWKAYKTESENVLSRRYDRLFSKENKK
tara:strand:+ start:251 stop:616 length:366 start_codon:yes stop_codon:yes gene_type:complete